MQFFVSVCDLFTLVLSLLDVCVLPLISIEPRLHAEVWLSAPLVQFVPRFVPRLAVIQYSLKQTGRMLLRLAKTLKRD